MEPTVYVLINGINTRPGKAKGWQGRGVRWLIRALKFGTMVEYWSGPLLSRVLGQRQRARELADVIAEFLAAGWAVVLVAHSNGADVVRDALELLGWPKIEAIHLFSAAISPDLKEEGFEKALASGQIGRMRIYVAGSDEVLELAGMFGRWLDYGTLGRTGPDWDKVSPEARARIDVVERPTFGHSSWWEAGENFEWSMQQIAA